jgi:antitoxin ParD1/3/4
MTDDEPAEEFAMDVTLTPELERLIHDKVASGLYTSEDEVIREALRLLKDRDELRILAVEDLRREVQKGLDQLDRGESVLLDSERIQAEGRRRLAGG